MALTWVSSPTISSLDVKPTLDTTSTAPFAAEIEKSPLPSVIVPVLEPFTVTEAPATGVPASEVIRPLIVFSWANALIDQVRQQARTTSKKRQNCRPIPVDLFCVA